MAKTYFTLTGTKHYYGTDFLEKGMKITLEKEPDNEYDKEAIQVKMKGMGRSICGEQSIYDHRRQYECRKDL